MKQTFIAVIIGWCISPAGVFAQGCSDAGFCTVDALKNPESDSLEEPSNHVKAGIVLGKADHNISIFSTFLEYKQQLGKNWSVTGKLTQLSQLTDSISRNGLSDVFLTAGYAPGASFSFTAGFKIPLTNGDAKQDNRSLPLDFQSSLGTFDLIAGIAWKHHGFRVTAAIQQPLSQNSNRFLATDYDSSAFLAGFQSTNGFERKGDVLLRGTYTQPLGERWNITPGLLAIYHLGEDTYKTASSERVSIAGSSGLTLNGTLFIGYSISDKHKLELSAGTPFIVRESRPDGLTRSVVVGLEYKFLF